jgi:hypothetical protein
MGAATEEGRGGRVSGALCAERILVEEATRSAESTARSEVLRPVEVCRECKELLGVTIGHFL